MWEFWKFLSAATYSFYSKLSPLQVRFLISSVHKSENWISLNVLGIYSIQYPPYLSYNLVQACYTSLMILISISPLFSHFMHLKLYLSPLSSHLAFAHQAPLKLSTDLLTLIGSHGLSLTLSLWPSSGVRCLSSLTWTISIALQWFPWIQSIAFCILHVTATFFLITYRLYWVTDLFKEL